VIVIEEFSMPRLSSWGLVNYFLTEAKNSRRSVRRDVRSNALHDLVARDFLEELMRDDDEWDDDDDFDIL
jgi:hypothetical protein